MGMDVSKIMRQQADTALYLADMDFFLKCQIQNARIAFCLQTKILASIFGRLYFYLAGFLARPIS